MRQRPAMPADSPRLYIIGLGVSVPDHTTLEAAAALAKCDHIFTVVQQPPAMWLPHDGQRVPVTNLLEMYVEGALRNDNYEQVSRRVFNALESHRTIAYVTYGNPVVYDSVTHMLIRLAADTGVPARIVPSVSSIDTLLCDLQVEMAPGLQIYEASWVVGAEVRLNVSTAVILVQMGLFGTLRAHYRQRPTARSLQPLSDYLRAFYPPTHQVTLVCSGNGPGGPRMRRFALDELARVGDAELLGGSLYIPALLPSMPSAESLSRVVPF